MQETWNRKTKVQNQPNTGKNNFIRACHGVHLLFAGLKA
jgi:hypothetical protein